MKSVVQNWVHIDRNMCSTFSLSKTHLDRRIGNVALTKLEFRFLTILYTLAIKMISMISADTTEAETLCYQNVSKLSHGNWIDFFSWF